MITPDPGADSPGWRSGLGTLVAPGAFAVAVAVLLAAGSGELAAPPVRGFGDWLAARGPVTAAVALVRIAALAAACWLLVITLVGGLGRIAGLLWLADLAERAMPPAVRRVLTGLAGVGVAGSVALGGSAGSGSPSIAAPAAAERLALPGTEPAPEDDPATTATMSVLPAASPPPAPRPAAAQAPTPAPAAEGEWIVEPGDSFWSIAEDVLTDRLGRPPTDAEVDPYWRALIEANRDRLASADPDLIFPGQRFVTPPPA